MKGGSRFDLQLGRDSQGLLAGSCHENRFMYDPRRDFEKVRAPKIYQQSFSKLPTDRLPRVS